MRVKLLFTFLFLFTSFFAIGQTRQIQQIINPTGSYKLVSDAKIKNGDVYGYSGNVQVKLLDSSRIAISFFVTKGMPSYNSGSFFDTLVYKDNTAIYKTTDDSTCKIIFRFSGKGIKVEEKTADYNFGCGFGHAVVADGYYKKISAKIPTIKSLSGE